MSDDFKQTLQWWINHCQELENKIEQLQKENNRVSLSENIMRNIAMSPYGDSAEVIEFLIKDRDKWKNLTELAYKSWISDSWLEFVEQFDEAVRGE